MNTKSLLERLGKLNIVRLRIFNFKLVNNLRFSLFKEISAEDIRNFIRDYRNLGEAGAERNAVVEQDGKMPGNIKEHPVFSVLERLCEQYYVYEGTDRLEKQVLKEVRKIIEELRDDHKVQKSMEEWVDANRSGAVTRLRRECPEIKDEDVRLFCYLLLGFTPTIISVLLGKDKSVVYNRTSRLKARLKDWNIFL